MTSLWNRACELFSRNHQKTWKGGKRNSKLGCLECLEERTLLCAAPANAFVWQAEFEPVECVAYSPETVQNDFSEIENALVTLGANDMEQRPTISFQYNGYDSCTEGGTAVLTLTRDITTEALTVYYAQDYSYGPQVAESYDVLNPGTLTAPNSVTFAAGESTVQITIQTVNDNYVEDSYEWYNVTLVDDISYEDQPDYYINYYYRTHAIYILDNDAWTVSLSKVGDSIIESASVDGTVYSGGKTWDSSVTYPKFVLTRTGTTDPNDQYQMSCSVEFDVLDQYIGQEYGGGNYTLHRKFADGSFSSALYSNSSISWEANDTGPIEIYLNPYVGWTEADQTVTFSLSPRTMTDGQNYVLGSSTSASVTITNDEKPYLDTVSHGTTSTLAQIFHDTDSVGDVVSINLSQYFKDTEVPFGLTYSFYVSNYGVLDMFENKTRLEGDTLYIHFSEPGDVGCAMIYVTAYDAAGQSENWTIEVYSDRISGYTIEEKAPGDSYWESVSDSGDNWSLLWHENSYRITPQLQNYSTNFIKNVSCSYKTWSGRAASGAGENIGSTAWNMEEDTQYEYASNCGVVWTPASTTPSEIAFIPTVTLGSVEDALFTRGATLAMDWDPEGTPLSASYNTKRVGVTGIQSVTWQEITGGVELSANPSINGGGWRIFPEKELTASWQAGTLKNALGVNVQLQNAVPIGMSASVNIQLLDPMNQCCVYDGYDLEGNIINNPIGETPVNIIDSDNNGVANLIASLTEKNIITTLTISENSNNSSCVLEITGANAGDNFIVLAFPEVINNSIAEFAPPDSDDLAGYKTPQFKNGISGTLTTAHYTELLTVWRTLWIETQEMSFDISSTEALIATTPPTNGVVASELARACILVREQREIGDTKITAITDITVPSDIQHDTNNTWTTIASNKHYTGSGDESLLYLFAVGCFNSLGPVGSYLSAVDTILIFNDNIYDQEENLNYTFQQLQENTMLHEIVHAFGYGNHDSSGLMRTGMNSSSLTYTPADYSLTSTHIQQIQSRNFI